MLISSTVVCLLLDRIFYIVSPEAYKRKRTKLIFLTIPLCVCVAFVCVPGLVLSDGFYVGDGQVGKLGDRKSEELEKRTTSAMFFYHIAANSIFYPEKTTNIIAVAHAAVYRTIPQKLISTTNYSVSIRRYPQTQQRRHLHDGSSFHDGLCELYLFRHVPVPVLPPLLRLHIPSLRPAV